MSERMQLLQRFQAKAGCMYTQETAERLWEELKPYLLPKQIDDVSDAWIHYRDVRLGRNRIDAVCNEIRRDWERR